MPTMMQNTTAVMIIASVIMLSRQIPIQSSSSSDISVKMATPLPAARYAPATAMTSRTAKETASSKA
jgi:hypothetical protein